MNKLKLTLSFFLLTHIISAQSASSGSNMLLYGIVSTCAVLFIWAMFGLASNLRKIEAMKNGIDPEKSNIGILPTLKSFISPKRPKYATDGSFHHFTKGHDINLAGKPAPKVRNSMLPDMLSNH
ncbi:MAG: hypothetical protein IPM04_14220 [Saprospiraceae bacterium]|nr:hypothetical protein [Candidatus Brachybacter algidus]MBK8748942.1 hypothetical protein [Candidatus Brachybacter algidus]